MLDRQNGACCFECDSCADSLETLSRDFDAAWGSAKAIGWQTLKIGDVWIHACPDCDMDELRKAYRTPTRSQR